jgi:hypothetical protein
MLCTLTRLLPSAMSAAAQVGEAWHYPRSKWQPALAGGWAGRTAQRTAVGQGQPHEIDVPKDHFD